MGLMTKSQPMIQIKVSNDDNASMVTWVEADPRIKVGLRLELKGVEGIWTIQEVYSTVDLKQINKQTWNNNI